LSTGCRPWRGPGWRWLGRCGGCTRPRRWSDRFGGLGLAHHLGFGRRLGRDRLGRRRGLGARAAGLGCRRCGGWLGRSGGFGGSSGFDRSRCSRGTSRWALWFGHHLRGCDRFARRCRFGGCCRHRFGWGRFGCRWFLGGRRGVRLFHRQDGFAWGGFCRSSAGCCSTLAEHRTNATSLVITDGAAVAFRCNGKLLRSIQDVLVLKAEVLGQLVNSDFSAAGHSVGISGRAGHGVPRRHHISGTNVQFASADSALVELSRCFSASNTASGT